MNRTFRTLVGTGAAAVAIGAVALTAGTGSAADSPDSSDTIYIAIGTSLPHHPATAIVHGAFADYGTDVQHNQTDLLKFSRGTITIAHPDKQSHFSGHLNPHTCYGTFTITGKYTLTKGTGRYANITGHGTYVVHFETVTARTSNGSCDTRREPTEVGNVQAMGPAALHH